MLMRLFKTTLILQALLMLFATGSLMAQRDTLYPGGQIWFENESSAEGFLNQEFTFDFNAYGVDNPTILYSLLEHPDGMVINEATGVVTWTPDTTGVFIVNVKAYLASNEDIYAESWIYVVINNPNQIYFQNMPDPIAWVNIPYQYDVDATSGTGRTINYALIDPPTGMTINAQSGLIEWTPTEAGEWTIGLKAYFQDDPSVSDTRDFHMLVEDSTLYAFCAEISGSVTINNQPGGSGILISAMRTDSPHNTMKYEMYTDSYGNYKMELPKGQWILYCESKLAMMYQWYDNVDNPDSATRFNLDCDQKVTANFNFTMSDTIYYIYFTSYPPDPYIRIGDTYSYNADAVSLNGEELSYSLVDAPAGMTINNTTGMLSWTPTTTGTFYFSVKAAFANDASRYEIQQLYIVVMEPREEPCAVIKGTILKDGNVPLYGYVMCFELRDSANYNDYYTAYMDSTTGNYELHVPAGTYMLMVNGDFMMQYYNNVYELRDATPIEIQCTQEVTANFNVIDYPTPNFYNVSGRVTGEDNNLPVKSVITFIAVTDIYSDTLPKCGVIEQIETEDDGTFTIELPDLCIYKAVATPIEGNYLSEYYYNATNYNAATTINLTGDITDLNFTLPVKPNYNNSMFGIVRDTVGNGIYAQVIAFMAPDPQEPWNITAVTSFTDTSNTGRFNLTNLVPGDYYLFAVPNDYQYIPGFYKAGDIATYDWEQATVITIGANQNLQTNHEIILPNAIQLITMAKMEGEVISYSKSFKKGSDKPEAAETVSGVYVVALDKSGNVIDYSISDDKGHYNLNKVGIGEYTIKASRQGYDLYEKVQRFDMKENSHVNSNIILNPKNGTSVNDRETVDNKVFIYPNPANIRTNMHFLGNDADAVMTISDMLGNEVSSRRLSITDGENNISVETNNLPAGMYIVSVKGGNINHRAIVQVVH